MNWIVLSNIILLGIIGILLWLNINNRIALIPNENSIFKKYEQRIKAGLSGYILSILSYAIAGQIGFFEVLGMVFVLVGSVALLSAYFIFIVMQYIDEGPRPNKFLMAILGIVLLTSMASIIMNGMLKMDYNVFGLLADVCGVIAMYYLLKDRYL